MEGKSEILDRAFRAIDELVASSDSLNCNPITLGTTTTRVEAIDEPTLSHSSPQGREVARCRIPHWIDARCVKRRNIWGSERSLWRDYDAWRQHENLSAISPQLFAEILDLLFTHEMDGWRGIALATDVAAAGEPASRHIM